jgi:hypothetical protein
MKKYSLILIFLSILCTELSAQSKLESLLYVDQVWSLKKKALVLESLQMTEADKASFWPIYEHYHNAIRTVELEYIYTHQVYEREQHQASGARLEELSGQILKNDLQLARLRKMYFKKFKKALSPQQASSFMLLDHNWRVVMREEIINRNAMHHQAANKVYSKK